MKPVWIIDDDRSIRWVFEKTLTREDISFKMFSSAQEALRAVARALMRNHLSNCAAHAIRTGSEEERQGMYDELLQMIYKNAR